MPKKTFAIRTDYVRIFIIYMFPLFLWDVGFITPRSAWIFAILLTLLLLAIILEEKWKAVELGFRVDNVMDGLLPYSFLMFAGVVAIKIYSNIKGYSFDAPISAFFTFCIPASFIQEFAYRGYLFPKLEKMKISLPYNMALNVFFFILPHLIYRDVVTSTILSGIAGIAFILIYNKYRNIYLITLVHAIWFFAVVGFGIFRF